MAVSVPVSPIAKPISARSLSATPLNAEDHIRGSDSTYVLDGILYLEYDRRIEEHYTNSAGFTDPVFGLMLLLSFGFAPCICDLGDTKLYVDGNMADDPALTPLIGG